MLCADSSRFPLRPERINKDMGCTERINRVAWRIFSDAQVNSFLYCDDILSYGYELHRCPEFLSDLSNVFGKYGEKMKDAWESKASGYRIDFQASLKEVDLKKTCNIKDYREGEKSSEMAMKKWMLDTAIKRANDTFTEGFLYIKLGVDVPKEQILSCKPI